MSNMSFLSIQRHNMEVDITYIIFWTMTQHVGLIDMTSSIFPSQHGNLHIN